MKKVTMALLLNLVLSAPLTYAQSPAGSMRAMTEPERKSIKAQLDLILKNNQDECYVNVSNFNNIDVLSLTKKKQKTFIEKTSKNIYLRGDLSATLNLEPTETLLPEGAISQDSPTRTSVTYTRAVSLNPVEITYSEIETQTIAEGFVTHVFENQNGQAIWKYSTVDLLDGQSKKPHVRCKAKGGDGFPIGKSVVKPVETNTFKFLDLEFIIPEYCLLQCSDLTVMPTKYHTF